jgi:hypothetical protein
MAIFDALNQPTITYTPDKDNPEVFVKEIITLLNSWNWQLFNMKHINIHCYLFSNAKI